MGGTTTTTDATSALDIRADFPILGRIIDGRPIVYLDSGATSQKPESVIAAMDDYYRCHNANIHRSVYTLAQEATDLFEGARERIAAFTGAETTGTIFTRNATEAINLVAYSWARANLGPGDAVLITEMEHHSNIVPWQLATAETGAELRYLDVSDDGTLSLDQLDTELARGDVRLIAVAHVSNVLGTINPVAEIIERAHRAGVLTLIDGSQAVPGMPVDVGELDADFYVWTGHKVLGPTGIGVLHGRTSLLKEMRPFLSGGDMISHVDLQRSTWNDLPWKFEAGTSMIAEAVGLGAAVDYLSALGMGRVREHEHALTQHALTGLATVPGVRVVGPAQRAGIVSFVIDGMHPHDIAELVNRDNVCIRAGHHCAQPLMRRLGVGATARASFGPYNVASDVDALVASLRGARDVFEL
ncbi:MAG: cysteine desulfurase / selenocysteine lyase [Solirubrobacteraceae bacterium]|jgi:cysteine desulfurase/selenocysteine lyase|nr:cysteine desulfurase / selenocysteine lyase [Solirubrobacteraceae bacterium]